ncbi:hypothetical protein MACJ_002303 [Theileria orientalis]|uniref:Uncharacterized protein n=1 Tax=Theileria orientalis TaxID=68886 RepID=A0A976QS85_THEOR|nr:hypothetical protein MACJ_002303 [Theileria orientalis]
MGGSYSDLNVYLRGKKKYPYKANGYTLTSTKKNFDGCCNFVEFTHKIDYNPSSSGRYYNVLLYDGYYRFKGKYLFGYYYPGNDNEVIQEVRSYYSVLAPNHPLVISFVTKANINYNCLPKNLKNARWNYASYITQYSSLGPNVTKDVLDEEFKKLLLNRTIKFTTGQENVEIAAAQQKIRDKNFRFIFLPKDNDPELGSEYLFSLDVDKQEPKLPDSKEPNNKNHIDKYFLTSVNGQYYNGIMVYFERSEDPPKSKPEPNDKQPEQKEYKGKVLLLEFIDSCKSKTHIRRKDEEGCWWAEEKVPYDNDNELLAKLTETNKQLKNDVVTVILDEKDTYNRSTNVEKTDNKAYMKYTHIYGKENKPVLLFQRTQLVNGPLHDIQTKAKKVEVYYLKAGGKEDSQPFLIVFDPNGQDQKEKKAYHFTNTDKFEEWKEFKCEEEEKKVENEELVKKLEQKVERIKQNGSCINDLTILRWYAYEILIGKDPKPEDKIKEKEATRPPEQQPSPTTEPLNIPLIVGGSVGGVVFVVSSAVGYGIYWYNTTIKLLT